MAVSSSPKPRWRLKLLGGCALYGPNGNKVDLKDDQLRLLVVLATMGPGDVSVNELIPRVANPGVKHPKQALDSATSHVRQKTSEGLIITETNARRLDPALISNDVSDLRRALEREDDQAAVALYEGEFLEGDRSKGPVDFTELAESVHRELHPQYCDALASLYVDAGEALADGHLRSRVEARRRDGDWVVAYGRCLLKKGRSGDAFDVLHAYGTWHHEEYGGDPEGDWKVLYRKAGEAMQAEQAGRIGVDEERRPDPPPPSPNDPHPAPGAHVGSARRRFTAVAVGVLALTAAWIWLRPAPLEVTIEWPAHESTVTLFDSVSGTTSAPDSLVFIMIRPASSTECWLSEAIRPTREGEWSARVQFGENEPDHLGERFDIEALIHPAGDPAPGEVACGLRSAAFSSARTVIRR